MARIPRLLPLVAIAVGGALAVRAVGAGPGLLDGARAWAEEAAPSAPAPSDAPKVVPAVCALTPEQLAQQAGVSVAELRILQSLKDRRVQLDARDTDLATALPLLLAAEQKLDAKLAALEALKTEINGLIGQVDERAQAETDRLVAVYSAMRPRDAAAVFATLDDSVRLPIAAAMRPRALSAILAQMPPAAAKELTEKLARRFQAQQQAARAAVAEPAPVPATTPTAAPAPAPTRAAAPRAAPQPRPTARAAARPPAPTPAVAPPTPTPEPQAPQPPTPPRQSVE